MPPSRTSVANRAMVQKFCDITGAEKSLASSLLEACGYNLEMAVNMHMEGVQGSSSQGPQHRQVQQGEEEEEEVRAPIPQRQEVLVEGPDEIAFSFRGRRRVARSVFDKFRDFEAETKRQEEELLAGEGASTGGAGASTSDPSAPTPANPAVRSRRKMKTLEDLFRPPIDLIYRGTFQTARDAGVVRKKWLMVNVQDASEFPCQVLNRDVWSNAAVKAIIREHFIFWQVYHDSEEGQRFMMFYRVKEWPHVSVLDPRTGECLATWHKLDALTFSDLVTEFLSSHPGLDSPALTPPKKKPRQDLNDSILEADEASQIEAAIKASLAEAGTETASQRNEPQPKDKDEGEEVEDDGKDDSDTLETFDSDPEDIDYSLDKHKRSASTSSSNGEAVFNGVCKKLKTASEGGDVGENNTNCARVPVEEHSATEDGGKEAADEGGEDWREHLGPSTDPESRLMLRLPDGARDIISMPSSSKLLALVKYVCSKGFSSDQYELVTNFPRRQICSLDPHITLLQAGLHPHHTVFIHPR